MQILDWIAAWPGAVWLQQSGTAYLIVNACHILGVGLLLGGILPLDFHLIGVLKRSPLSVVGPLLVRVASTGLAIALLTGLWLFSVKPREYVGNPAFGVKLVLLTLAIGNIGVQHYGLPLRMALEGRGIQPRVRIMAALSVALWLLVLLAGRWIGFA